VLLLAIGCIEGRRAQTVSQDIPPTSPASLDDLSADAVTILRKLPGIADVKRHGPSELPTHRIVHIADWHFVDGDDYAADLRCLSDEPLSDEEIDRRHAELLDEVELVQEQQIAVLRWLIEHHGLKRVHIEGLSEKDQFIFDAKISVLRTVGQQLADLRAEGDTLVSGDEPDAGTKKIIDGIEQVGAQYRRDLLQLGAAARLVLSGELEGVVPLEDAEAYAAANPVEIRTRPPWQHTKRLGTRATNPSRVP
jgi:hypothetical protein